MKNSKKKSINNTQSNQLSSKKKKPKSTLVNFIKKNWITILAFLYVVSPIDLLPEALLPLIGETDDLLLIFLEILRQWHLFKKKDKPES